MTTFLSKYCFGNTLLCLLLLLTGCLSSSHPRYSASQLPDKSFAIIRHKCLNLGSWDLAIDGDIIDSDYFFDYGFCYTDKSHQIKISCVDAYAHHEGEAGINMYDLMKELLYAKSNILPKLSAKDISSAAWKFFNGNDVIEYETEYAKGFIYRYPYSKNEILVLSFSKDTLNGFLLTLKKINENDDDSIHEEYAFKVASSIRFSGKSRLNKTDFKDIFNKMHCHDSAANEETVVMKLTRYYIP